MTAPAGAPDSPETPEPEGSSPGKEPPYDPPPIPLGDGTYLDPGPGQVVVVEQQGDKTIYKIIDADDRPDSSSAGDGDEGDDAAPDGDKTPDADAPDADAPNADTPDPETPDAGTPDAGTPDAGTPADPGEPDTDNTKKPTTPYRPGDEVDDEFIDQAEEAGAETGEDDEGRYVILDGKKYHEGDELDQDGADAALAMGIEKDDPIVGNYHEGDLVTDELEKTLKDLGWYEDGEGNLVSPDGEEKIPLGKPLDQHDADYLTEHGIKKTASYLKNHPDNPLNSVCEYYIGEGRDMTEKEAEEMGYDKDVGGDHPPQIHHPDWADDGEFYVSEYDEDEGRYVIVGFVKDGKFHRYSDERMETVNVDFDY